MTRWDTGTYEPVEETNIAEPVWEHMAGMEDQYPDRQAMVVPFLLEVTQHHKWVSEQQMLEIADFCDISPTKVLAVASFYTMIYTEPVGDYNIQVCRTLSCALQGGEDFLGYLSNKLGVEPGETTEDERFTLTPVECLAACCDAPVVQINQDYFENISGVDELNEIIENLPEERTLNPKEEMQ